MNQLTGLAFLRFSRIHRAQFLTAELAGCQSPGAEVFLFNGKP